MEATISANTYPIFNGPLFTGSSKEQAKFTDLARKQYNNDRLVYFAQCVANLAFITLGVGCLTMGASGIFTAVVSLSTVGMADASIKLLASWILLKMFNRGLKKPLDYRNEDARSELYKTFKNIYNSKENYKIALDLGFISPEMHKIHVEFSDFLQAATRNGHLSIEIHNKATGTLMAGRDKILS